MSKSLEFSEAIANAMSILFKNHVESIIVLVTGTVGFYYLLPNANQKELKALSNKVNEIGRKLDAIDSKFDKELKEMGRKLDAIDSKFDKFIEMHSEQAQKVKQLQDSQETLRNSLVNIPERLSDVEYKINSVGVQTNFFNKL